MLASRSAARAGPWPARNAVHWSRSASCSSGDSSAIAGMPHYAITAPVTGPHAPGSSSAELAAQAVEVTEHPGAGEPLVIGGEEGRARVLEPPPGGGQPQQRTGVRPGVGEPGGCPRAAADQLCDLVMEVSGAGADQVAVLAPAVPAVGLLPQRSPEHEPGAERAVDRGVVPAVPQLGVEPLDQFGDTGSHPLSLAQPPRAALVDLGHEPRQASPRRPATASPGRVAAEPDADRGSRPRAGAGPARLVPGRRLRVPDGVERRHRPAAG